LGEQAGCSWTRGDYNRVIIQYVSVAKGDPQSGRGVVDAGDFAADQFGSSPRKEQTVLRA